MAGPQVPLRPVNPAAFYPPAPITRPAHHMPWPTHPLLRCVAIADLRAWSLLFLLILTTPNPSGRTTPSGPTASRYSHISATPSVNHATRIAPCDPAHTLANLPRTHAAVDSRNISTTGGFAIMSQCPSAYADSPQTAIILRIQLRLPRRHLQPPLGNAYDARPIFRQALRLAAETRN